RCNTGARHRVNLAGVTSRTILAENDLRHAGRAAKLDRNLRKRLRPDPRGVVATISDRGVVTDRSSTWILGISAFYHDSAACLLRDGEIVAAGSEERFTRKKGDADFPKHAVEFCLRQGGIGASDLAFVGFYDKPLLK